MHTIARDYNKVISSLTPVPEGDRTAIMQGVVDALWAELKDKGCSWVGFYLKDSGGDHLVLGPRRDKPACSPIGLHGACGQVFQSGRPLIVTDVTNLRTGYIACDPRDKSEAVIPLFDGFECYGVLDADSFDISAFSHADVQGMVRVLQHVGLTNSASVAHADLV